VSEKKLIFVEAADVETQVFDWGRLNWLSEPRVTAAEKFSAGLVALEPGKGHGRHNHPGVEEILYVVGGRGLQMVEVDGKEDEREVGPGVLIHIPPDVFHSTINTGDTPLVFLAIYAPPGPEAQLRASDDVTIEPPIRPREKE
jgi:oxalate decarboxylase/phosphoglucose isomerase-like protein (cupin superfamily)